VNPLRRCTTCKSSSSVAFAYRELGQEHGGTPVVGSHSWRHKAASDERQDVADRVGFPAGWLPFFLVPAAHRPQLFAATRTKVASRSTLGELADTLA